MWSKVIVRIFAAALVAGLATVGTASAAEATNWIGDTSIDNDWFTASNWDNGVPTSNDYDAYVPADYATSGVSSEANPVVIGGGAAAEVHNLRMGGRDYLEGAVKLTGSGTSLTVNYALDFGYRGYGALIQEAGTTLTVASANGKLQVGNNGNTLNRYILDGDATANIGGKLALYQNSELVLGGGGSGGITAGTMQWGVSGAPAVITPQVDADGVIGIDVPELIVDPNYAEGNDYLAVLNPVALDGATPGTYTLITAGTTTGEDLVQFADGVDTELWSFGWVDAAGGGRSLEVTYVPEPATMTLVAFGGLGLLLRRRRNG